MKICWQIFEFTGFLDHFFLKLYICSIISTFSVCCLELHKVLKFAATMMIPQQLKQSAIAMLCSLRFNNILIVLMQSCALTLLGGGAEVKQAAKRANQCRKSLLSYIKYHTSELSDLLVGVKEQQVQHSSKDTQSALYQFIEMMFDKDLLTPVRQ